MDLDLPIRRGADKEAEIPLSGARAEFRAALRAEIEAAERGGAMSVTTLEAGRRIGRVADAAQYVFSATSAISIPSDTPGELIVDGLPPLRAVVISVEGLDVTVSVSRELGERVPRAILQRDTVLPLRHLIARIEQAGSRPNTAGDRLLGDVPASGAPEVIDEALLDDTQDVALGSSLGRDITFICGPSGSGKTQTIGSIGAHLYRRGRSLLLVAHTNRAVDQALVEIAQQLGDELDAGVMLRLGIPCDHRLRERADLLLDAVVWNRQEKLRGHQTRFRAEKAATQKRIAKSERLIEITAWAAEGRVELADFLLRLRTLQRRETNARRLAEEVARRAKGEGELLARLAEAQPAARAAGRAGRLRRELRQLVTLLDAAREAVGVADAAVAQARWDFMKALELEPLVARERVLSPLAEQRRAVEVLTGWQAAAKQATDAARETLREAESTHVTATSTKGIQGRFRRFGLQIHSRQLIAHRGAQLAAAQVRVDGISERLRRAEVALAEREELDRQLTPWRKLGSPAKHEALLKRREAERALAVATRTQLAQRHAKAEHQLAEAAEVVEHFHESRAAEPGGVVARLEAQLAELSHLRERLREAEAGADDLRTALNTDFSTALARIEALGLGHGSPVDNAEKRFVEVAFAQSEARRLATGIEGEAVHAEIVAGRRALDAIEEALVHIDQELEGIRRSVIAEAQVIATTLTRVYLWNELQYRRFDTVILDEASMAPIPALWIAAQLADANVVVVGDLRQPLPLNQSEHPLAAKWLGQDIFDASRIRSASDQRNPPPHTIVLKELADRTASK